MNKDDIRSLTRISRSLWGDLDRSAAISEDTLTSVSLLNLSDAMTIERASKVMIERAERNPPTLLKLNHPFFRLAPIERFLLTALHVEDWSYSRVARTLGVDPDLIAPWAWATRLKYAFQELAVDLEYPRGPSSTGASCEEYNAAAPWTQRMLDDELNKRDRLFLQNHIMACNSCRHTLDVARKLLFKLEEMIPVRESSIELEVAAERILDVWRQGEATFRPIKLKSSDSFVALFNRREIQWILSGLSVFCFLWFRRH